jgi:hypothetical protein
MKRIAAHMILAPFTALLILVLIPFLAIAGTMNMIRWAIKTLDGDDDAYHQMFM